MPGSLDKVTLPVSHSSQTTEHCMQDAKTLEGYGRPAAQSLRWIVTLSDNVDLRYPHERYKPSFFVYKSYEILNYSLTYLQFGDFYYILSCIKTSDDYLNEATCKVFYLQSFRGGSEYVNACLHDCCTDSSTFITFYSKIKCV